MPDYRGLRSAPERDRIMAGLLRLRDQLDHEVPRRDLDSTLRLGTWNIREFDSPAYGARLPDAYHFIAEIISRFDLVAIQEVRRDLTALRTLMRHLGGRWRHLVTDTTEGAPGNNERLAFVYDTRKVAFTGLAGELVLPDVDAGDGLVPVEQIARTPFTATFQSGWVSFQLATVHIVYGDQAAAPPERVREIGEVAKFLAARSTDPSSAADNLVLLGDFNIFDRTDTTMAALTDAGWIVPDQLKALPGSNVPKDKFYDQIAMLPKAHQFQPTGPAGVFDYYTSVFRLEDRDEYATAMGPAYTTTSDGDPRTESGKATYYKTYWRTFQMSDHLPMWVDLQIDYSTDYLHGLGTEPATPVTAAP